MFTKKKSLARIAQLRSKKFAAMVNEEEKERCEAGASVDDGPVRAVDLGKGKEKSEEDEEEEEERKSLGAGLQSSQSPNKRLSLQSDFRFLSAPMRKEVSNSSPDLNSQRHQDGFGSPPKPGVSRNHSLRYSGGALHGSHPPCDFDHNYGELVEGEGEGEGGGGSVLRRPERQELRRNVLCRRAENRSHHLSSSYGARGGDGGAVALSSSWPRRTQSMRAPPQVRLGAETADAATSPIRVPRRSPSERHVRPTSRRRRGEGDEEEDVDDDADEERKEAVSSVTPRESAAR